MVEGRGSNGIYFSEKFQNPLFDSNSFEGNGIFGFPSSKEAASKRIRLSPDFNQQEGDDDNSFEQTSPPLGLTLSKTPSFLNLVEMKLSQARQTNYGSDHDGPSAKKYDFASQPMSERLKASNFPATLLKIGSWERVSRHDGDLTAKCYYAKRKFVWEVLEGALKSKIEIQWSDIVAIRAIILDNEPGILEIELNQPPLFFRETNPQPRKHTLWHQAADFTGGQALICRTHSAMFPPGILDKHYEKLLQCDHRLFLLSQKPFPTHESPYFHQNVRDFSFEFPHGIQFPVLSPHHHHLHNLNAARQPPLLRIMDSDSSMSVMDYQRIDERSSNYSLENQRMTLWGRRLNNVANNFARIDQIQDYQVMNYGEEARRTNPNNGILCDIENHLLGDSQVACSDETTLLARVSSMCSLLKPQEQAYSNNYVGVNRLAYEHEKITNDYVTMSNNANIMMMNPARKKRLYPCVFSEPTVEDFDALDGTLDICHWS